jgi:serine/threonine-protein kinase
MAEIFLARANSLEGLERYVVLKRIRPEHGDDPRWVRMFLDEARLAAQLQHPNIAQVFDLGRIGDDYFYTMEYVHGKDVLEILANRNEALPANVALAIIVGAASGLAHAHERLGPDGRSLGIVHRDVSPANIMVSYEGTVKVLDFGVAKARFREQTEAGTIMGKMAYLSPEQCRSGRELDHRSDIFSLGIVLYEMLTGARAFRRDTDFETLRAVVNDDVDPPSKLVPDLPKGLDEIVLRALAKDPRDRFATVNEMTDAIEEVAELHGMALTAGVLRRYMRDTWGSRPEPWRALDDIELGDEDILPVDRTFIGLPADAKADAVPPLQATGLIDISALFSKTELGSISRAPVRAIGTPPTGGKVVAPKSSASVAVPALPFAADETGVLVGYGEPPVQQTAIIRVAPGSASLPAARRKRSLVPVVVAVAIVGVVAVYFAFVRPHAHAPAAAIAAPSVGAPIVMPSQRPAPAIAPPAVQRDVVQPDPDIEIDPKVEPAKKPAVVVKPKQVDDTSLEKPEPVEPKPAPKKPKKPDPSTCTDPLECQF